MIRALQPSAATFGSTDLLPKLAAEAIRFLDQLKAGGQLAVQSAHAVDDVDTDIATAWLITEVAKRGLTISTTQIAETIDAALRQRQTMPA